MRDEEEEEKDDEVNRVFSISKHSTSGIPGSAQVRNTSTVLLLLSRLSVWPCTLALESGATSGAEPLAMSWPGLTDKSSDIVQIELKRRVSNSNL